MSRHNRDGTGIDQRGYHYRISYPPDWLDRIRVTRRLASGRKSTRTLFRNPVRIPEVGAGGLQRIRIESPEQELVVEAAIRADPERVCEIVLCWRGAAAFDPRSGHVAFTFTGFSPRGAVQGDNGPMDYLP